MEKRKEWDDDLWVRSVRICSLLLIYKAVLGSCFGDDSDSVEQSSA